MFQIPSLNFPDGLFVSANALTGSAPISGNSPYGVMLAIVGGEHPPRPTNLVLTEH